MDNSDGPAQWRKPLRWPAERDGSLDLRTQDDSDLAGVTPHHVLCVDLDGTLVATDTLWECVLTVLTRNPMAVYRILRSLARGKARFKSVVADNSTLHVARLPFRLDVLQYLERQKAAGRLLILVTAAHQKIGDAVAAHLGIFDQVIATTDYRNLKGPAKGKALVERFEDKGFSYAGNSAADLPVWEYASTAITVGLPARILRRISIPIEASFPAQSRGLRALIKATRLHQWAKNLLVFVPLITSRDLLNLHAARRVLGVMFALGMVASAQYLFNDLIDLDSDRNHPKKKHRAFASGQVAIPAGVLIAISLLIGGVSSGYLIGSWQAASLLGIYFVVSFLYSVWLKARPLVDVFTLAGLYVFRIIIGGFVSEHHVTAWLLNFSFLCFLGLGFLKRYIEIARADPSDQQFIGRRRYYARDAATIGAMGIASSFTATVVLALYVYSQSASLLYRQPSALWGFVPIYLLIECRLWLSASRGYIEEDPVWYVISDRVTWLAAGLGMLVYGAAIIGWG